MNTINLEVAAFFCNALDIDDVEKVRNADQCTAEAPEIVSTALVFEEDGQTADRGFPPLDKIERAGKGERSCLNCQNGLFIPFRIFEQVMADGLFIAFHGDDLRYDPLGGDLQAADAGVKGEHLVCQLGEIRNSTITLVDDSCYGIGRGKGTIEFVLNIARDLGGRVCYRLTAIVHIT